MELQLSFLFVEIILSSFLFQESAALHLPSSLASMLLPIKAKTPDFRLYKGRPRFFLLQNDDPLLPKPTYTGSGHKGHDLFAAAPHHKEFHAPHVYHPSSISSNPRKSNIASNAYAPSTSRPSYVHPGGKRVHGSTSSAPISTRNNRIAPQPHHGIHKASQSRKGPNIRSITSPSPSPLPSSQGSISTGPLPLPAIPSNHFNVPSPSPTVSPMSSPMISSNKKYLPPLPSLALPPPPPNQGCASFTCTEPLTYTPSGASCGCVWPIEIRLSFSISLYTFFPLVSDLAEEIAASIHLDRNQVRIMGADAADQQLEKTTVLINLVPLDETFNSATAFSIYHKFWKKDLSIKASIFGAYKVLYVRYPGLPPSPPSGSSASATIDIQPYPNDDEPIKPLGVDVPRGRRNDSSKNIIIIIVLSSVTAFVVLMGFVLLIFSKWGCNVCIYRRSEQCSETNHKATGGGRPLTLRSRARSSASMSFSSSLLAYTGTARVFSLDDISRATNNFDTSRIVGEGGFGLVFGGILDDGREVAVKVLKRDDQQGSREFLAEVEMLGRLHHRNLVKLIGICPEDHCRCLVYELVPNGSVESHLHGDDDNLDWRARMKIALGAARGLAYLHEDSSPRVIHRDFKSSNILLEHDYTPKVSDFGLARAAMEDEGNKHFSTHVMGTFGYLAPEYAMTGHLLVKSDVYSYGVVLLELLTGRKPVDLSQPPGQENLVSWARPLLATKQGLETIIDPSLKPDVPVDNFSKVAAIASMCVQPEVSHRPFMGEVVQALKLVCNEFEETIEPVSRSFNRDDELCIDVESEKSDSGFGEKIALSAVDLKSASIGFEGQESESFRREFNSAPMKMGRKRRFWQRLRGLSGASMSEHEYSFKL